MQSYPKVTSRTFTYFGMEHTYINTDNLNYISGILKFIELLQVGNINSMKFLRDHPSLLM